MTLPITPDGRSYYGKHGYMARMDNKSGLGRVFGNGVGNHKTSLVSRSAKEILTGMFSFDSSVLQFQQRLSDEFNESMPVTKDADGFSSNGIHVGFDRLRTVAGYMSDPMSYTPLNNDFYRKELNLSPGYNPRQKVITKNALKHMFKEYLPSHVKVPKLSTSGPRRNTSDPDWKRDFALFVYEGSRFEAMLKCVDSNDWESLANELEMLFMMYIQKREQVDMPGKPRLVFDLEYALTNGRAGRSFNTNKNVVIDGKAWETFSATRARVIHAGPWVINCIMQIISSGHMYSMFDRYPNVFHISTAADISKLLDGKYVECGDVKEYDRSMSKDAIDAVLEAASEYWDPRLIKMSRLLYYSPYYARPLSLEGGEGVFVGDPRLMTDQVVCGNRSGHAWTSLVAKINKCIDTLFVFDSMGLPVLGNEETYFLSNGAINFVNNGDDEMVYTDSSDLMKLYKRKRYEKDNKNGHYVVESEAGQGFSGLLLVRPNANTLTYKPTPKVHTAFEKIYTPERSIGGTFRQFWPIGMFERVNNQDLSPMGQTAWEIHNRLFEELLAPRFGSFLSIVGNAMERMTFKIDGLSSIDKDVLEDPDRIHYKYLESDISKDVYETVTSKIPFELYEHIVTTYYKGNVK